MRPQKLFITIVVLFVAFIVKSVLKLWPVVGRLSGPISAVTWNTGNRNITNALLTDISFLWRVTISVTHRHGALTSYHISYSPTWSCDKQQNQLLTDMVVLRFTTLVTYRHDAVTRNNISYLPTYQLLTDMWLWRLTISVAAR